MSYGDQKSTWNSSVLKAIRRGSAEGEVCKHRDHVTGALKQISSQRRQVNVSYDPNMVTALQHCSSTWMDEKGFKKTCIKEKETRGDTHKSLCCTWVADFMLRQDAGMFMLGKYLSNKKNPMEAKKAIWDGSGRKYTNSQFSDQKRQDAISRVSAVQNSRVSAVQNSARGPGPK